jgi:hypothetical protein
LGRASETSGLGRRQSKGKRRARTFIVPLRGKEGQTGLGVDNLNHFDSIWGTGAALIVWYLALEYPVRGNSDPECEGLIKEVVERMATGLYF